MVPLAILVLAACRCTFVPPDSGPTETGPTDTSPTDTAIDADGDGYAEGVDCDDTDPAVYPGAAELCDGVDNDCDGIADDDGAADNVLVVIADDFGVDQVRAYGDHTDPGNVAFDAAATPIIDRLVQAGVLFEQAWSAPLCSPTRSGILTGRPPFQTGMGEPLDPNEYGLDANVSALPDMLPAHTVGLFGKWHLGDLDSTGAIDLAKPLSFGFAVHSGSVWGQPVDFTPFGSCNTNELGGYSCWDKHTNGIEVAKDGAHTVYATVDTAQDTIAWIDTVSDQPWVAIVSFNAPHYPWDETPPAACLPADHAEPTSNYDRFQLMIQCMDQQLGSILRHLATTGELQDTTVIFVGDNGTESGVATTAPHGGYYPSGRWKGSVHQGGVHVPLVVADGHVLQHGTPDERAGVFRVEDPGRAVPYPVHTQDIFNTTLELTCSAQQTGDAVDSTSMVPYLANTADGWERQALYTERFDLVGDTRLSCQHAIRDETYKLVRLWNDSGTYREHLYELEVDPLELDDLLDHTALTKAEQSAYDALADAFPHNCD